MKWVVMLLAVPGLCFGVSAVDDYPWDGRTERAEFVLSLIKPGDIGLEIGVQMGIFAHHVLLPARPAKLYLVDPWLGGLQGYESTPVAGRVYEYDIVCHLFASHPEVEILKMTSTEASGLFPDQYFDYIYIDDEHSYRGVWADLNNYFSKVKVGGYIIGDDYGWDGIAAAVQDFLRAHQDELIFSDDPYSGRTGGQYAIRRLK